MPSPCILAIETTTEACSVGLSLPDRILVRHEVVPRQHTHLLLPMIEALLKEAGISLHQLQALACTIGPGSFTGVRIGTAVVQALSYANQIPVIPISTLRAMAQQAYARAHHPEVFASLDAGQQDIYGALFSVDAAGIMQALSEEKMLAPKDIVLPNERWKIIMDLPHAQSLLQIAKAEYVKGSLQSAEQLQPVYLDKGQLFKKAQDPKQ